MQDLTGSRIQDYIIEHEVGRGGMARVYRARHVVLQRPSALKVLLPDLANDESFVERFLREARAAARLDHPNIVPIYETGQYGGIYFIAMRFLDGTSLRDLMQEGPVSFVDAGNYVRQIADALDYAHRQGIIHRDIKPANIVIENDGRVGLTDFGIARAIEESSVTAQGSLVGTPAYMSPEQAQGLPTSPASDVYSLGIVVYELLTGETPFPRRTPHAVLLAHISEAPLPVHEQQENLTPEFSAVLSKALAKNPEDRYASAGEFSEAFSIAIANAADGAAITEPRRRIAGPVPDEADTLIEPPKPPWWHTSRWISERGRWFAGGAITMAITLFIVIWLAIGLAGGGDDPDAGTLAIDSDPPGASVSVDGRPRGQTPVTVEDLNAGEHIVQVSLPSYAPVEQPVRVRSDEQARVEVSLQPLPASQALQVSRATTTSGVIQTDEGIDAPADDRSRFAPDEEVVAFVYVTSEAFQVRDLSFTFESHWYDPAGTLRATSPPEDVTLSQDGQVWHLLARDRAGDVDPNASGEPSRVELLIDGEVIQALEFRVEPAQ